MPDTLDNIFTSRCSTCGYAWLKGQSGHHSCSTIMDQTIKALRAELVEERHHPNQKVLEALLKWQKAEDKSKVMRGLMNQVEWVNTPPLRYHTEGYRVPERGVEYETRCPWCQSLQKDGHTKDCSAMQALKENK